VRLKDSCGAGLVVLAAPYICNILVGKSGLGEQCRM
jgi:hypothetical protein